MTAAIDLNADLGETVGGVPTADDDAIWAGILMASIACGGHAGDAASMRKSVLRAVRFGVAVGGHPSYPDAAKLGRVRLRTGPTRPTSGAAVAAQLQVPRRCRCQPAVREAPRRAVPRGHRRSRPGPDAVVDAIAALSARPRPEPANPRPRRGEIQPGRTKPPTCRSCARRSSTRGYQPDGSLVSSTGAPGALLPRSRRSSRNRAVRLALDGIVEAVDGAVINGGRGIPLRLHGDSSGGRRHGPGGARRARP